MCCATAGVVRVSGRAGGQGGTDSEGHCEGPDAADAGCVAGERRLTMCAHFPAPDVIADWAQQRLKPPRMPSFATSNFALPSTS